MHPICLPCSHYVLRSYLLHYTTLCYIVLSFVWGRVRFTMQRPHYIVALYPHLLLTYYLLRLYPVCSRLYAHYLIYIYSMSLATCLPLTYHLLTTYYIKTLNRPFHTVSRYSFAFQWTIPWGVSLFTTQEDSAALSRYFFIFIFFYSANFYFPTTLE